MPGPESPYRNTRRLGVYLELVYILPVTIGGGWWLGRWLAGRTGSPLWELAGIVAGALAGLAAFIRVLPHLSAQDEQR